MIIMDEELPEGAQGRRYGCRRDTPDHRDFRFALVRAPEKLPDHIDLHDKCRPIWNQGQLGCCTGEAAGAAWAFCLAVQIGFQHAFDPSAMFIYYCERTLEGTIQSDAGAMIRTSVKALAQYGACAESLWPLRPSLFATKPNNVAFAQAVKHKALQYYRVSQDLDHARGCLAEGFPVIAGISVYQSFESDAVARTGLVPIPHKGERLLGGHAILLVGYDDARRLFLCRNSWGMKWGDAGYFYLPYEYVASSRYASDFWTLRLIQP